MNESGSKIMNIINKVGNAIMLNLLFLISCVPVVTIGAAWSGLYSAVRFSIRGDSWFQGYKEGFKARFGRNTLIWLADLLLVYFTLDHFLLYLEYLVEGHGTEPMAVVMTGISGVMLLAGLLFLAAFIPVNLYIPTEANQTVSNSWDMVLHAPLQVLGAAALMWLPVFLALFFTGIAFQTIMVFVAAYFVVAGVVMTMLLKDPLIRILQKQRKRDGVEWNPAREDEEDDEEYEDE